ncbi:hypothetical protein T190115A13A_50223 [Tenacibaculum sp. 190524A02b]|uniref:Uncharacterized protein n=1 Tax=Tenacibaculum vairaonense TaxID=3137860 RepID=A0ABP1FF60_9FLAO
MLRKTKKRIDIQYTFTYILQNKTLVDRIENQHQSISYYMFYLRKMCL